MKKLLACLLAFSILISLASCAGTPAETTLPEATPAPTETTPPPATTLPPETTLPLETTVPPETEPVLQTSACFDHEYKLEPLPWEIASVILDFLHCYIDQLYLYSDADYHQYSVKSLNNEQQSMVVQCRLNQVTAADFLPRMDLLDANVKYWKETRQSQGIYRNNMTVSANLLDSILGETYALVRVETGMTFKYTDAEQWTGSFQEWDVTLLMVDSRWVVADTRPVQDSFYYSIANKPEYQTTYEPTIPQISGSIEVTGVDGKAENVQDIWNELEYFDEGFIIFSGPHGLFGYDLVNQKVTFSVDPMLTIGVPFSYNGVIRPAVTVSADGNTVMLYDSAAKDFAFYIDPWTGKYECRAFVSFENVFDAYDFENPYYGELEGATFAETLFRRGDETWLIFENWNYD